jgi:heme-degrading monooxygenase HmoA
MRYGIFLKFITLIGFLVFNLQNGNTNYSEHSKKETKNMFITITLSKVDTVQLEKVEKFLAEFLPRFQKQPGVNSIYHFDRPDKGDEVTVVIWESEEAVKAYRQSELIKEAIEFEKANNLPATREGYPLKYKF